MLMGSIIAHNIEEACGVHSLVTHYNKGTSITDEITSVIAVISITHGMAIFRQTGIITSSLFSPWFIKAADPLLVLLVCLSYDDS